jgi:phage tail sheath protein FI
MHASIASAVVFKAPANEQVLGATGLEFFWMTDDSKSLIEDGVNCFRFFPDRGFRLFGARLASSDPDFKYVNVRRLLCLP